MAYFQRLTFGRAVIMGRLTYESLPPKLAPLKQRINIIISRNPRYDWRSHTERTAEDCADIQVFVVTSLAEAFQLCVDNGWLYPMVTGGGQVYRQALEEGWIWLMYVTEVRIECEGTVFFNFDPTQWTRFKHWAHQPSRGNPYAFDWDVYKRVTA